MQRKFGTMLAVSIVVLGFGLFKQAAPAIPELSAVQAPDGRSIPDFLNSIDDPDHIAHWRSGLDVTREFLSYCHGMSTQDIVALFSRGDQAAKSLSSEGKYYYVFRFRSGDMNHLVDHLSHFPLSPDTLEFWIIVVSRTSDINLVEAKIVDRTAYP